ncbi:PE-PGRS family protein [Streptomyces sp. NPDC045431]|uniref:PE-PGRS family protein n=1 Tax=Streptomyces sp. NPDC045431 TaxID=3155613 RepID=UPI003403BF90
MASTAALHGAWLHGLAMNPSAPTGVLLRVLGMAPDRELPFNWRFRRLPPEVIEAWAHHPHPKTRRAVAEHIHLTPEQRTWLLDVEPRMAYAVALNAGWDSSALTEAGFERLATHEHYLVRGEIARHRRLPPAPLRRLAMDPEPGIRRAACPSAWEHLDAAERAALLADEDDAVRSAALLSHHRDGPPMDPAAYASLVDDGHRYSQQAAEECLLTRDLAERLVRDEDSGTRCAVARNPRLDADLAAVLCEDPYDAVRLNASVHPALTEEQRAAARVEVAPHSRHYPLRWVQDRHGDVEEMRRCAASGHVLLRRSVATARSLPADVVELLAKDEDFAVRLMLAERCAEAPGHLLLEIWETWDGRSAHHLPEHPNFPREGLLRYADDPRPRMRELALLDPDCPTEVVERLSRDPEEAVRRRALDDPRLSAESVVRLTRDPAWWVRNAAVRDPRVPGEVVAALLEDRETADEAAANPTLPEATMHELMDRAGLPDVA